MQLYVYVQEAKGLQGKDLNGLSDPYVILQLGRTKQKTRVIRKTLNPSWNQEFTFKVDDLKEELLVSVWDDDRIFNDDFLGQVRVVISDVMDAEKHTMPVTWFPLQTRGKKSKVSGEILLTISLYVRDNVNRFLHQDPTMPRSAPESPLSKDWMEPPRGSNSSLSSVGSSISEEALIQEEKPLKPPSNSLTGKFLAIFAGKDKGNQQPSQCDIGSQSDKLSQTDKVPQNGLVSELSATAENFEDCNDTICEEPPEATEDFFEEGFDSTDTGDQEIPSPLPGGILLDKKYSCSPKNLNAILFAPKSEFRRKMAEMEGSTNLSEGPWRKAPGEKMKRTVTYTKGATKLVKAVKATEEQTYLRSDGKVFVVFISVSTPDVPFGNTFRVELLFCITAGPESASGDETCHLLVTWRINFIQSTMMKGMIEGGAKQGLNDSYQIFAKVLTEYATPIEAIAPSLSETEQAIQELQMNPQSDWKLIVSYIGVFNLITAMLSLAFFLLHILLSGPTIMQGLEFGGIDLPDSFGELLTGGLIVLQVERIVKMISRFMHARFQKASDHGVKAHGDGWLLTVALVEGENLAAVDVTGFSDPYVVFSCNGKCKTSSIKLQTLNPQWHEIFEYDAMEEAPSVMDVEVFDFEGPFADATSLGYAEINFLKFSSGELSDLWIPLQGRLAQACGSRLHLRIFLTNTKGPDIVTHYITKMEKEVGKKIQRRSPQSNSTFQKLFGLPGEEFLINDFSCYLKRKMPLQGRLFLSSRMLGFYANLFGHKTKFSFLWEDIEEIKESPASLASMGSPSLIIFLRRGRGSDASHGAKCLDEKGRLKFHFQAFVSYNNARRTIMALWRNRALTPEQKMQIVDEDEEEQLDTGDQPTDDAGQFLGVEEANMTKVHSKTLPLSVESLMEVYEGGRMDKMVMEKMGCQNYRTTAWELIKPKVYQRQVWYKYNKTVSGFVVDVTSTQQKSMLDNGNGWIVDEVLTLRGVPFGDHFQLQMRIELENLLSAAEACSVRVYIGVTWLKSTTFQNRITGNICEKFTSHLKEMFQLAEEEILLKKQQSRQI